VVPERTYGLKRRAATGIGFRKLNLVGVRPKLSLSAQVPTVLKRWLLEKVFSLNQST
jgi:hypothetical protein